LRRKILLFTLSVLLAFIAAALVFGQIKGYRNRLSAMESQYVTVPAAARDIEAFGMIASGDITTLKVPRSAFPEGEVLPASELAGKRVLYRVAKGDPLLKFKLAGTGGKGSLSLALPNGMRAVSMAVDEVSFVSGHIRVDDRVDVVILEKRPGGITPARNLLSGLKVLAIGIDSTGAAEEKKKALAADLAKSVVLEVTPQQAPVLAWAQRRGDLWLSLRPAGEEGKSPEAVYAGPDPEAWRERNSASQGSPGGASVATRPASEPSGAGRSVRRTQSGWQVEVMVPGKTESVRVPPQ
jgi:pilus assembly protein CpaB